CRRGQGVARGGGAGAARAGAAWPRGEQRSPSRVSRTLGGGCAPVLRRRGPPAGREVGGGGGGALRPQTDCPARRCLRPFALAPAVESRPHVWTEWGQEMAPALR